MLSFWRGNTIHCLAYFPGQAALFATHDLVKNTKKLTSNSFLNSVISGMIAGFTSSLIVFPFEMMRVKQVQDVKQLRYYGSSWQVCKDLW